MQNLAAVWLQFVINSHLNSLVWTQKAFEHRYAVLKSSNPINETISLFLPLGYAEGKGWGSGLARVFKGQLMFFFFSTPRTPVFSLFLRVSASSAGDIPSMLFLPVSPSLPHIVILPASQRAQREEYTPHPFSQSLPLSLSPSLPHPPHPPERILSYPPHIY